MNRIDQDIKNKEYSNFYLLYGAEDYLKNRYAELLIKNIVDNKDSMNYSYYEDNNIDGAEVIDAAVTLPFFADKRVIHIKNSGWFNSVNTPFNNYLDSITESTIFIFVEDKIDKRTKAFKAISKIGCVAELNKPSSNDLKIWIGGKLKKENKAMEKEAYQEFVKRTDNSMDNMTQEFEKLLSYTADKDIITLEDVNDICTKQLQLKIFDMINAIAERNPKKVLDLYHDLLATKEPPLKILIIIQRQFRRIIVTKDLREQGHSDNEIIKLLKTKPFIVQSDLRISGNFPIERINMLLNEACQLENDIKTGNINDQMAVELLIVKYASPDD
ncbi:MAG: DNA polymerase III subunit delta [Lachnospiraceae bacterium]|nr:DNA polymerase III subunit delta [Lachnospiraceae bacterium]